MHPTRRRSEITEPAKGRSLALGNLTRVLQILPMDQSANTSRNGPSVFRSGDQSVIANAIAKDQSIGDCTENAVQPLTLCRQGAKEPKVFQYVGIEPRFDMSEKTVTNLQSRI